MHRKHVKIFLARVAVVALALALVLPLQYAGAWTQYPVTAQLATGDITSAMIRNGDIVNADISASALIDAFKIFAGATGGELLFSSFGRLGTSTAFTVATTTNRFGIGSTSPSATLGVQGNALVSGTLTAGNVTATSTLTGATLSVTGGATSTSLSVGNTASTSKLIVDGNTKTQTLTVPGSTTLNGVAYTWPSADGTNGQLLTTNGAGAYSFTSVTNDFILLTSTTTTYATATIDLTLTASSSQLLLLISSNGYNSGSQPALNFNGDSGAQYGNRRTDNGGVDIVEAPSSYIQSFSSSDTTDDFCMIWIRNIFSRNKTTQSSCLRPGSGISAPTRAVAAGNWNNSTSTITTLRVKTVSGETFNAGAVVSLFGTRN